MMEHALSSKRWLVYFGCLLSNTAIALAKAVH